MTTRDLLFLTRRNNGHTQWLDDQIRSGGYVVAYGPGFVLPEWVDNEHFEWFVERLMQQVRDDGGDGIGTWVDDDVLYLDAVRHIETLKEALRTGYEANQIAIYSIAEELVIDVEEPIESKEQDTKIHNTFIMLEERISQLENRFEEL